MYRYSLSQSSSIATMILFFLLVAFVPMMLPKTSNQLSTFIHFMQELSLSVVYGSVGSIVIAIYLFSWLVTMKVYERKAF